MFGFGKKKEEEDLFNFEGEGKFPPAEDAFNEPNLNNIPKPLSLSESDSESPFKVNSFQEQSTNNYQSNNNNNMNQSHSSSNDKIEIVIAKLDSLKSNIEVLNQRLIHLENKLSEQERRW